jgi:hypothetical protein
MADEEFLTAIAKRYSAGPPTRRRAGHDAVGEMAAISGLYAVLREAK